MQDKIGWIGLGSMGNRMAKNLAKNGYQMLVTDKMDTSAAPQSAHVATTNSEVISEANILILSIPAGPDTLEITQEILNSPSSSVEIVIDTSTIGIPDAKQAAELLSKKGIEYVDAPVDGETSQQFSLSNSHGRNERSHGFWHCKRLGYESYVGRSKCFQWKKHSNYG